ncbi:MAG: DotI/IcmL/TraM family protein [Candidatus Adiutrix sp.]
MKFLEIFRKYFRKGIPPTPENKGETGEAPVDKPVEKIVPHDKFIEKEKGHGLQLVIESRNWFKTINDRLFTVLIVLSAVGLLSVGGNIYQFMNRPKPSYFAVTNDFKLLEMPALSQPVVSDQAVLNWAANVITETLSLNFLEWRKKLSEVKGDYEKAGFDSLLQSLVKSGNLKKIEDERLNLSCVIREAPIVTNSGLLDGRMTWRLELPILLSYQSSKGIVSTQSLIAKVLVQRTDTAMNPKGIHIKQIVLAKN